MPKVNVYLPADLARDVKGHGISLSPVCQAALRVAVMRAEASTATRSDLAAVADRLALTDKVDNDRRYLEGYGVGADWAREAASLRELRGVSRHCEGDLGRSFDLVDIAPSLHSFLMVRYAALDPEADWFERIDTETAFNRGLVEGAAAVYEVVRPLLASRDIAGAPKEQ
jgi:hypothetical protein